MLHAPPDPELAAVLSLPDHADRLRGVLEPYGEIPDEEWPFAREHLLHHRFSNVVD